ncbi:MAG TPA: CBS domain-containing protein [Chloroflexota bacterium]|nr:CBS domain-containing protein [Chloroflexota bacterium]
MTTEALRLYRLRQIAPGNLVDTRGDTVGRVEDVIVRLERSGYPAVTGLQARIGDRSVFVPIEHVAGVEPGRTHLTRQTVDLGRFERRPGEVLLRHEILNHALINVEAGRLVRAVDVILGRDRTTWHVVGIDPHPRPLLQRVLHTASDAAIEPGSIIDWSRLEPLLSHVPSARLRLPLQRLRRLHPAQIADLVEAASHDEGEEIITTVRDDPALEADVFEELDTEHQLEFLQGRTDEEAAALLAGMAADDAADLISDLDQSRRADILARLPDPQQTKVRRLLAYNPQTAGGLMHPDFLAVGATTPVRQTLEQVKEATIPITAIFVVDPESCLLGLIALQDLLRTSPSSPVGECAGLVRVQVTADADFTDIALRMTDYNLTALPVVDESNHVLGAISVDDVLELLVPQDWRRRGEGGS